MGDNLLAGRYRDPRRPEILCHSTGLRDEFLTAVDALVVVIRAQPERGRRKLRGTFSFRTERFPFRIVYDVQPDRIWI